MGGRDELGKRRKSVGCSSRFPIKQINSSGKKKEGGRREEECRKDGPGEGGSFTRGEKREGERKGEKGGDLCGPTEHDSWPWEGGEGKGEENNTRAGYVLFCRNPGKRRGEGTR